jgi:lactobin A/cerein 7B family class IIb bacteriocin
MENLGLVELKQDELQEVNGGGKWALAAAVGGAILCSATGQVWGTVFCCMAIVDELQSDK